MHWIHRRVNGISILKIILILNFTYLQDKVCANFQHKGTYVLSIYLSSDTAQNLTVEYCRT